jgi:hypothetical protein
MCICETVIATHQCNERICLRTKSNEHKILEISIRFTMFLTRSTRVIRIFQFRRRFNANVKLSSALLCNDTVSPNRRLWTFRRTYNPHKSHNVDPASGQRTV